MGLALVRSRLYIAFGENCATNPMPLDLEPDALVHLNTNVHMLRAVWMLVQNGTLRAGFLWDPHGEDSAAARPPRDRPTTASRPPLGNKAFCETLKKRI